MKVKTASGMKKGLMSLNGFETLSLGLALLCLSRHDRRPSFL